MDPVKRPTFLSQWRFGLLKSDIQSTSERKYVEANVEKITSRIRELRKQQGLSQEKLAEVTSISVSTIKFIEQNQRAPSVPMLLKILFVLNKKATIWG
ncbi:MAG: helix-turn-helix transcriptional regulator [Bdellovibrionales bacterium]|nr:helix-turn-helix transcriptional regulator [Bdellovibrionales bacterium]